MGTNFNPNTAGMFSLAKHLYLSGWTNWKSRATRREFWLGSLGWAICMLPLSFAFLWSIDWSLLSHAAMQNSDTSRFLMYTPLTWSVYALMMHISFVPIIGSVVRRFHDIGRSGWWCLLLMVGSMIPFFGIIADVPMLVFFCKDSQKETNKWGISPKYGAPLPPVHPPAA